MSAFQVTFRGSDFLITYKCSYHLHSQSENLTCFQLLEQLMIGYLLNQNTAFKFGLQTLFNWIVTLNFRFFSCKIKKTLKTLNFIIVIRNYVTLSQQQQYLMTFLYILGLFSPQKGILSNFYFCLIVTLNKKEPKCCQFFTNCGKALSEFMTSQTGIVTFLFQLIIRYHISL